MDPLFLALLLLFGGVLLLVAELFLPTHGLVGVLGAMTILAGVGVCFYVNPWLGLGVLLAVAIASPFAGALAVKLYPHTFIGRRMVLRPIDSQPQATKLRVGQIGVAVSAMRPMGMCDFDEQRLEAQAERGWVQPGQQVQVVAIIDNRPTVRAVGETNRTEA